MTITINEFKKCQYNETDKIINDLFESLLSKIK